MTRTEKRRLVLRITAFTSPVGALVGVVLGFVLGDGTPRSVLTGAVIGVLVSAGMVSFNVGWEIGAFPRRWTEAPFVVVLLIRSLIMLSVIVVGLSVPQLTIGGGSLDDLLTPEIGISVVISFFAALVINFIVEINQLLGRGVLVGLMTGRYHRPREEVRVFLFVDLRGSTPIAERLGNMRYHSFLKRFIADVSNSMIRHSAEVHRSIGDGMLITWTDRKGLHNANCLRAVFDMSSNLERTADEYVAEFGVAPEFWAGMHVGPVVTGEVGTVKHEIVYLGDTPNTAARIEQACRQFDRPFLVSADVMAAVELPDGATAEPLGAIELRGIGESIELFAVASE